MDNTNNKYGGMTVNERLYVSGLMDKFNKAVEGRSVEEVIYILNEVEINTDENISAILKSVGLRK